MSAFNFPVALFPHYSLLVTTISLHRIRECCQLQSKSETVHDPKYSHLTALVGDAIGFWGPGNQFTSFFLCNFLTSSYGEVLHFHYSTYIAQIYGPRVTRVNFYCPWAGLAQYTVRSVCNHCPLLQPGPRNICIYVYIYIYMYIYIYIYMYIYIHIYIYI